MSLEQKLLVVKENTHDFSNLNNYFWDKVSALLAKT